MKRSTVPALAAIVLCLMTLVGCQDRATAMRIGVIACLTGPIAPYGQSLKEGAVLAAAEVNASAKTPRDSVVLVIDDAKSTPNDALLAFKKQVDIDRLQVVMGIVGSSLAMAVAPEAERRHVVFLSTGASTPDFTKAGDYCFRNRSSAKQEVERLAEVAYGSLAAKRVAILYVTNDYGVSYKKVFAARFAELGGTVVLEEGVDQGATDMRAQLEKARALGPDAIYVVGQALEAGHAVRQARELGVKAQLLGTIGMESADFLKIAGNSANGVIYSAANYNPNSSDSAVASFERNFEAKYGKPADLFAANAYDAVKILVRIMRANGRSSDQIKAGLYAVKDYPGASGLTSFDANGDVTKPIAVKSIKDGKFVVLDSVPAGGLQR